MKYILLAIVSLSMISCTVYGFSNDYKKLLPSQKDRIVILENFKKVDSTHVYKINGQQLNIELKNHPKSLVYIFSNGCSSEYCLPMSNYERFAKENGYKLFLVMEGYGNIQKTLGQRSAVFTSPLYSIDNDYYNSWYSGRFSRLFENDLRGIDKKEKPEWNGNLFFFEYNKLIKVARELPN